MNSSLSIFSLIKVGFGDHKKGKNLIRNLNLESTRKNKNRLKGTGFESGAFSTQDFHNR